MLKGDRFWVAFLGGLAAPWSIWGGTPEYSQYVNQSSVEETFGQVGADLKAAMGETHNDRAYAAPASYSAAIAAAE